MNFHSACKCRLILMKEKESTTHRYDIMSGNEYIGGVRFCTTLGEWIINLSPQVGVTHMFMTNIWDCLIDELSEGKK